MVRQSIHFPCRGGADFFACKRSHLNKYGGTDHQTNAETNATKPSFLEQKK